MAESAVLACNHLTVSYNSINLTESHNTSWVIGIVIHYRNVDLIPQYGNLGSEDLRNLFRYLFLLF